MEILIGIVAFWLACGVLASVIAIREYRDVLTFDAEDKFVLFILHPFCGCISLAIALGFRYKILA